MHILNKDALFYFMLFFFQVRNTDTDLIQQRDGLCNYWMDFKISGVNGTRILEYEWVVGCVCVKKENGSRSLQQVSHAILR